MPLDQHQNDNEQNTSFKSIKGNIFEAIPRSTMHVIDGPLFIDLIYLVHQTSSSNSITSFPIVVHGQHEVRRMGGFTLS